VNWGHGVVLLLTAAAVQFSTLWSQTTSGFAGRWISPASTLATPFLVISIVLAVIAAGLAVAWKVNRYFLLLLAVVLYPYALQLAVPGNSSSGDLIGSPTPAHLALLFLPPLLLACWAALTARPPRHPHIPLAQARPD
jgi:hypothetical protein